MDKTKNRYSIVAFLLSYFIPGIGYIYVGEAKKSIQFLIALLGSILIFLIFTQLFDLYGFIFGAFIVISVNLHALLYPTITAHKIKEFTPTKYNKLIYYIGYASVYFVGIMIFTMFIATPFRLSSGNMKDSLLVGDRIFAKKFAYGIPTPHIPFLEIPLISGTDGHIYHGDEPKRGDIIIFRYPNDVKLHYVKRCVALPGDELFVLAKVLYLHPREGNEYTKKAFSGYELKEIDGKLWVKDPYTLEHPGIHHDDNIIDNGAFPPEIFNTQIIVVPEGEYFMMGDNRDHSNDSRFWGAVPYGLVEGTPWFVYFSIDDNYEVRWDRIGRTPHDLEQKEILDRAISARIIEDAKDNELY